MNIKPRYPDHRLLTRRDFIGQGLLKGGAFVVMPSILGMIANESEARAACAPGGFSNGAQPFLVFDHVGGVAFAGNFVPQAADGGLLAAGDYSMLGLGNGIPETTTIFGAPMAGNPSNPTQVSKILEGMLSATTPACRACIRLGTFPHESQSDTPANFSSAIGYVAAAGAQGNKVRGPVGTSNTESAGYAGTPFSDSTLKALSLDSVTTILNAINYEATLASLPANALAALAKAALNLSTSQAANLASMTLGQQFATLVECGFIKNRQIVTDAAVDPVTGSVIPASDVDPRKNPTMQSRYGIAPNSNETDPNVISATIVFNALQGYSGPGCIQIGNCDYHDNTQTTGDQVDFGAGVEIGRALQAAYDMGKTLHFQLISDGGIVSVPGTRTWIGDANFTGMSIYGVMKPSGPVSMVRTSVGHFVAGGAADSTTFTGNDPGLVAKAVFANYLNLIGGLGMFPSFVPEGQFASDLRPFMLFG